MTIFYTPVTSAFGQNIVASAGSKLFFFEVGTTTPKTTFSDAAETTPNTNPVIADSRGRFIPIFLTGVYDVELQDANGVQIWKALEISSSGITGNVVFIGNFDSSTNAGDYPATGSKGDLFVVTTGFTLNPASGSHVLSTRDFIIANIDSATGVDADWDIIRGVNAARTADIVVTAWAPGRAYVIGDYVKATDNKLYRALLAQSGNDPAGGGDTTNWLPFGDLIDDLVTDDSTRGGTAANDFTLKNLIDNPGKATITTQGIKFLFKRILLSNDSFDIDHAIEFASGNFTFNDGSGSAALTTITKLVSATWVLGDNVGGLADALTVAANTSYHCFSLSNPDGSSVDAGFDTDINAVNLLADLNVIAAGLTKFKRQGSRETDASANWFPMFQYGKISQYVERQTAINTMANLTMVGVDLVLRSPLGLEVRVLLNSSIAFATANTLLITALEETDLAPSTTNFTLSATGGDRNMAEHEVKTDILSQIRYRSSVSNIIVFTILFFEKFR